MLKAPPPAPVKLGWSAWGAAFGGVMNGNGSTITGTNAMTARDFGFATGMDYHFTPWTLAGFALAGGGTNWSVSQGIGGGHSDAFQFGVYGATRSGPTYLGASFAFANHWMSTSSTIPGDLITATFNAQSYGGRLEGGYRYALQPNLIVSPYAAVQAQAFHSPTYTETDSAGLGIGLTYSAKTATDTRSELGARFDSPTVIGDLPLMLRGRIAWAHDWVSDPSVTAAFQALPGASFVLNGAPLPRDSALVTAGADLFVTKEWTVMAKFYGEFAGTAQTYAGSVAARYTW